MPQIANIRNRIPWIDTAKALGILLVVFGHTLHNGSLLRFIYAFHVPLFFFLSGVTFSPGRNFRSFLGKKARTLLIPYCIVMAVSIILFSFLGELTARSLRVSIKEFSWPSYFLGALYGNADTGYLKANLPCGFCPACFVLRSCCTG